MVENNLEEVSFTLPGLVGRGISAPTMMDNIRFVEESKRKAATHDWLYHCTTAEAFFSMIKSREMWLSNLKLVNDQEEVGRIDLPEYEKRYFVGCFTYDPDIPAEHWDEYGKRADGILWAVKRSYFKHEVYLMSSDNKHMESDLFQVHTNMEAAFKHSYELQQTKNKLSNPYYMLGYGFYQVVYDDELKKTIHGDSVMHLDGGDVKGSSVSPDIPGIIKSTHGLCQRFGREPYEKDWTTEKEVRLKVSVQQLSEEKNGNEQHDGMIQNIWFRKVAVPFANDAFQKVRIRLSPDFDDQEAFMNRLRQELPDSEIEVF